MCKCFPSIFHSVLKLLFLLISDLSFVFETGSVAGFLIFKIHFLSIKIIRKQIEMHKSIFDLNLNLISWVVVIKPLYLTILLAINQY